MFLFASFWLKNFQSPRGKKQKFPGVAAIASIREVKQFLRGYTLKQKQTNDDVYTWSLVVTVNKFKLFVVNFVKTNDKLN